MNGSTADASRNLEIRRATLLDGPRLSRLFAAAFHSDPVFDWLVRVGESRVSALQRFFLWVLKTRALPQNETWMTEDGTAAAAWIPPYSQSGPTRLIEDLRTFPVILSLTGLPRLYRGAAMAAAMQQAHPEDPHFYLAFIAVAPRLQGSGLGSALLQRTLARIDKLQANAYLENSNPRNVRLYERAGFSVLKEIKAHRDAPPIYPMWRAAKRKADSRQPKLGGSGGYRQGSSVTSQYR